MAEGAESLFAGPPVRAEHKQAESKEIELFEQIGRLKMELEWVKKKLPPSCNWKREQVESDTRSSVFADSVNCWA